MCRFDDTPFTAMPRRTKEEAEQTRRQILEAARRTFHERGVSATSLEHIAHAAGVTRGAIYWHFENKGALFKAMREDALLPHMARSDDLLIEDQSMPPLDRLHRFLTQLVEAWTGCEVLREVLEIMVFKCEYVGPMSGDLAAHLTKHRGLVEKLERVHREAQQRGELRAGLPPRAAALETACFVGGLARLTLLQLHDRHLLEDLHAMIEVHVDGRRVRP
ncbi:TetR family transcriptional regulator [Caldimonas tepidiphila]|uniref:TetR family transcriptional regulator n=1 Tax=Caldimonas tepidiphila TaxID=2315841 RepID=UPI0013006A78|nr:TetR family transcriptional regulator [Caldimonas tepidiphila]